MSDSGTPVLGDESKDGVPVATNGEIESKGNTKESEINMEVEDSCEKKGN